MLIALLLLQQHQYFLDSEMTIQSRSTIIHNCWPQITSQCMDLSIHNPASATSRDTT